MYVRAVLLGHLFGTNVWDNRPWQCKAPGGVQARVGFHDLSPLPDRTLQEVS